MSRDFLPRQDVQVVDPSGRATTPYYVWFQSLDRLLKGGATLDEIEAKLRELRELIAQLPTDGFLPATANVLGANSVEAIGSLAGGVVVLQLTGDTQSPAPDHYYGSDAGGTKGFHAISDAVGNVRRPAAEPVSALRVVFESPGGVAHLDPGEDDQVAAMLGLSITAGSGEIVVRTSGTIDDAGWSWVEGFVFAGPDGTLTQTPPTAGWEIVIGYAPSATRLNLTFDEPVKLA